MKKFLTIGSILLCLALPAPTRAQNEAPAPFDGDLERLGEILGALHYLRAICGANVASFNRGYRGFQQTYRTCTPAADIAIRRYLDEGAKIAREITARYAN